MKKIIMATTAAAFLAGAITVAPTPASALIPLPFMYAILKSKENKDFKPVNPYAKKVAKKSKSKKAKK